MHFLSSRCSFNWISLSSERTFYSASIIGLLCVRCSPPLALVLRVSGTGAVSGTRVLAHSMLLFLTTLLLPNRTLP